ncbi:hypothetical protein Tco_0905160 [Tanacetum coccineum]
MVGMALCCSMVISEMYIRAIMPAIFFVPIYRVRVSDADDNEESQDEQEEDEDEDEWVLKEEEEEEVVQDHQLIIIGWAALRLPQHKVYR